MEILQNIENSGKAVPSTSPLKLSLVKCKLIARSLWIYPVVFACFLFIIEHCLISVLGVLQFTQRYQGKNIMGTVGSSMNFSWTFIGDPGTIKWGIKKAGANAFESNGLILSVAKDGTQTVENQAYNGRVNGIRSGNSQSAQVVFTLSTIEMKDMESYLCVLRGGFGESDQFDYLNLVVEGNYSCFQSV